MKATWNNQIIAESNKTIVIESNHYFPADSIKTEFFIESDKRSTCPWKGNAKYKTLLVNGKTNEDAAWYYPEPKEKAKEITGYYAFWKGVEIGE